jgi:hypothetical protein
MRTGTQKTLRRELRGGAVATVLVLVLLSGPTPSAQAEGGFNDYDRRAVAALLTAMDPEKPQDPKRLPARVLQDNVQRKRGREITYKHTFQPSGGSKIGSGQLRILVNQTLTDPTLKKRAWKAARVPKGERAQVFWRSYGADAAGPKWVSFAARRKLGRTTLEVALRLAPETASNRAEGVRQSLDLLHRLIKAGESYELFDRLVIGWGPGFEGHWLNELNDKALYWGLPPSDPTKRLRLPLRVRVETSSGTVQRIERFRFRLEGPLAKFATLEGAEKSKRRSNEWFVRNKPVADVTVVFKKPSTAFEQALYARLSGVTLPDDLAAAGLRVRAAAWFPKSPQPQ